MTNLPSVPTAVPPAPPFMPTLDDTGRLAQNITCRKCGYNLRGLLPDSRCPECGTAVGRSLHGDLLRYADPDWVKTLSAGMNLIVTAIIAGFLVGLLIGGVSIAINTSRSPGATNPGRMFLLMPWSLIVGVVQVVGYWKVTSPDPAGLDESGEINARIVTRYGQIAALAFQMLAMLLESSGGLLASAASLVSGLIGMVIIFAVFIYARRLAARIPSESLASQCRTVMWGLGITMFLAVSGAAVLAAVAPSPGVGGGAGPPGFSALASTLGCFAGVGVLVFGIWALVLIFRFRTALSDAASAAMATWAAQPASSL